MCNRYSNLANQAEIRARTRAQRDYGGNQPPLPGIFLDYPAPIVRNNVGERELALSRWGMPCLHSPSRTEIATPG